MTDIMSRHLVHGKSIPTCKYQSEQLSNNSELINADDELLSSSNITFLQSRIAVSEHQLASVIPTATKNNPTPFTSNTIVNIRNLDPIALSLFVASSKMKYLIFSSC